MEKRHLRNIMAKSEIQCQQYIEKQVGQVQV